MALITQIIQHALPQHAITRLGGWFANNHIVWLKNILIRYFCWRYAIKVHEALSEDLADYPCFNAFFTRRLKSGLRFFPNNPKQLASPSDCTIGQVGNIVAGHTLLQAKGHHYQLNALLAQSDYCQDLAQGSFITQYLSPQDYHRVHMPTDGQLLEMIYIPGTLFSVNPKVVNSIESVFTRNERVICIFQTPVGKIAVVLIGAMIVGGIVTSWHGTVCPPHTKAIQRWDYREHDTHLQQGDELGYFKFGSTVVMITQQPVQWTTQAGATMQLGKALT